MMNKEVAVSCRDVVVVRGDREVLHGLGFETSDFDRPTETCCAA